MTLSPTARRLLPILLLLLLALPLAARAQDGLSATLTAEPAEATVGDPLTLTLTVNHPAGYRVIPPELEGQWGDYTVVDVGAPQTTSGPAGETTTIAISARLFAPGAFATPPLTVTVTDGAGGLTDVTAAAVSVNIVPVLAPEDTELRDIKPQADMPATNWALIAGLGLIALAVAGVVLLLRRRAPVPPVAPPSPYEAAQAELARIEGLRLPEQGRFKEHYSQVGDVVRAYVGSRYGFPTLERTTGEIRAALPAAGVPADVAGPFVELLQEGDLVKFTTITPAVSDATAAVVKARSIIEAARPVELPANGTGPLPETSR
jgi:hypothetical protein